MNEKKPNRRLGIGLKLLVRRKCKADGLGLLFLQRHQADVNVLTPSGLVAMNCDSVDTLFE